MLLILIDLLVKDKRAKCIKYSLTYKQSSPVTHGIYSIRTTLYNVVVCTEYIPWVADDDKQCTNNKGQNLDELCS